MNFRAVIIRPNGRIITGDHGGISGYAVMVYLYTMELDREPSVWEMASTHETPTPGITFWYNDIEGIKVWVWNLD